ncbi:dienelactone hydrolase [Stachybotrys elegans]|uniref:Dienelactone hydrolase n=1 Tax=Stachybotrys elegans TaxID=80388 RepID=A0A8K0WMC3_9HYPO|nr:dienelactone hydrolase [Stachybotrys elegans]
MSSHPTGQCCSTIGSIHQGTPRGESVKIDGKIEGYLSRAQGDAHSDAAILFVPDIFGIWQNNQLVADAFAARGYTTLIPDLFNGDQLTVENAGKVDIMGWFAKGSDGNNPHTPAEIDPVIVSGIKHLQSLGFKRIGSAGYCIGAKYVVRHFKSGIDCGFLAHPSFVTQEELEAITGPLSIAAAETDSIFPAEKRHESEVILQKMKLPYQISLFSGVEHGFAVRGKETEKQEKFAKEQAFLQAAAWFDNYLV